MRFTSHSLRRRGVSMPPAFTAQSRAILLVASLAACAMACSAQSPAPTQSPQPAAAAPATPAPPAAQPAPVPAKSESQKPVPPDPRQAILQQSEQLLKMANDLWNEVDKSTKDTLSVTVIRKADAIEHFARDLRTQSTTEVGTK